MQRIKDEVLALVVSPGVEYSLIVGIENSLAGIVA
jgi:hypothetical protein